MPNNRRIRTGVWVCVVGGSATCPTARIVGAPAPAVGYVFSVSARSYERRSVSQGGRTAVVMDRTPVARRPPGTGQKRVSHVAVPPRSS
jgi:hypothetical protein